MIIELEPKDLSSEVSEGVAWWKSLPTKSQPLNMVDYWSKR